MISADMLITILISLAIGIVFLTLTKKGKLITAFLREVRTEIRKIVWPTCQETFHTTLIILSVTTIMSLILWGIDNILIRLVSFITNLRF